MRIHVFYCVISILLIASCKPDKPSISSNHSIPEIFILENDQTDYKPEKFIRVLTDTTPGFTIQQITQPSFQHRFQPYPDYTSNIQNYQYYWGKLQLENRLNDADQYSEWVLLFTDTWTNLDIFIQEGNGTLRHERSGAFTPVPLKSFVPTAKGNHVKLVLPPRKVVTIYFHGISERTAIYPSFYVRLKHIQPFYEGLLKNKVGNAIFIGFLLMIFLYNLLLYFFGKDQSFIFYSGYLIMVVVYAAYSSEDLADWFGWFSHSPQYLRFMKLSLYLAMMGYMGFIRSFLDLGQLLPKWDRVFRIFIYLGFPLMILDLIVLQLTNFSYVIEDRVVVPYIILMLVICCSFLYPLYKTKDKKGYFVIAGVMALCVGAVITVVSLVWLPPFSIFYLKAGTIIEVLIFSVGLAYRQWQQKQAQQEADFKLKESQLIQAKKQVEADQLKELNEFKARFYTNITHEFRTPLTVIMGISETIKKHEKEKEIIQRNSQNLLRLINQLLDLSKLESGTLSLNQVHQDIIFYLQYLTESFYLAATQKNIRLLFHSEEKVVMMDYDEEKIQQIVYNLLSNALKFTKERGKIIFHASKIEKAGLPFLKLKVKDNGIGIPKENISNVFDRFYQAHKPPYGVDQSNRQQGVSTGIGLALTKELIELMKGRIEVQSQVGEGTEFILYLPIETKATTQIRNEETYKLAPPTLPVDDWRASGGIFNENQESYLSNFPKLLIIEDNQDIITYIKTILNRHYQIHTASNGVLGVEQALEIIPDIIISDVMMPGKSGYEVCEALKQDERTSHIPIILLTAKATQTDKVQGLKYGADVYLTKPFDKEELVIQLEKLVKSRRQLQRRYTHRANVFHTEEPSVDDLFLQKLWDYIQENLGDSEFGVPQLAEAIDMSQMQVYRKLKALTGKTPSQFIRSYRLHKGLELLQKEELTISEIAYEVGFSDPSYFSRVFQKEFGKSPSDFLK